LLAIALSIGIVALRWRIQPRKWTWHIGYFVMSQYFFSVGIAIGQVYASPASAAEAAALFNIALTQGSL
jgi:hypothetical protein